jgi:hypothetical protein
MPPNPFPDSAAKRELRRMDGRELEKFRERLSLATGLRYCGMPSVAFLDVKAWQPVLHRSLVAVEYDKAVLSDMKIQYELDGLPFQVEFVEKNINDFLRETKEAYDVYNLDFYGGFIYTKKRNVSNTVEALRALIQRHRVFQKSFMLVATFNVREKAGDEYDQFIDQIPEALVGWENVKENCEYHKRFQYRKIKLGFPYFCLVVGRSNGFTVDFKNVHYYSSGNSYLMHFCVEFEYQMSNLPTLHSAAVIAELANGPLIEMIGPHFKVHDQPPEVRPPTKAAGNI